MRSKPREWKDKTRGFETGIAEHLEWVLKVPHLRRWVQLADGGKSQEPGNFKKECIPSEMWPCWFMSSIIGSCPPSLDSEHKVTILCLICWYSWKQNMNQDLKPSIGNLFSLCLLTCIWLEMPAIGAPNSILPGWGIKDLCGKWKALCILVQSPAWAFRVSDCSVAQSLWDWDASAAWFPVVS